MARPIPPVKQRQFSSVPESRSTWKIWGLVTFAFLLLAGIVVFVIFRPPFSGETGSYSAACLSPGMGGIPWVAGASAEVGQDITMEVHANLGDKDAYGFYFELQYNPVVLGS